MIETCAIFFFLLFRASEKKNNFSLKSVIVINVMIFLYVIKKIIELFYLHCFIVEKSNKENLKVIRNTMNAFLISFKQFFLVKCPINCFTIISLFFYIKITNNIATRKRIFNFFNHKNFFAPIWNESFAKNFFISIFLHNCQIQI